MNIHSPMPQEKKVVLITGATAGIGRDAALYLAGRGHRVIASGRSESALAKLVLGAGGNSIETLRLDVTDPASIAAAVATVDQRTAIGKSPAARDVADHASHQNECEGNLNDDRHRLRPFRQEGIQASHNVPTARLQFKTPEVRWIGH